ncbi:flagellar basal body P-ring formation chaperone FlgA [Bartonella sp. LJL80]
MKKLSLFVAGLLLLVSSLTQAYADRVGFIVPTRTVYAGQPVSEVGLSERMFFIKADAVPLYVTDISQALNKVAKRTLTAGRPISLSALADPVLIERGQSTRLVFTAGDLVITATGVSLQPGSAGDFIKIRNIDSGRVVTGTVLADGSVRVGVQ